MSLWPIWSGIWQQAGKSYSAAIAGSLHLQKKKNTKRRELIEKAWAFETPKPTLRDTVSHKAILPKPFQSVETIVEQVSKHMPLWKVGIRFQTTVFGTEKWSVLFCCIWLINQACEHAVTLQMYVKYKVSMNLPWFEWQRNDFPLLCSIILLYILTENIKMKIP